MNYHILFAAIFGLAIGDALGVPYEFEERGSFVCRGMVGYGSHDQPAGTWSDDTSMTLATLRSIKDNNGKVVAEDIKNNFMKWLNEKAFTANGEVFDVGHATLKALMTGEPRMGEYENGNGSLMRILPLAFTDCTDDEIRSVLSITHGHWVSTEACVIYVHIARRLLAGETLSDIIPTLKYKEPFHRLCVINQLQEDEIKSSGYVVDTLEAALWALSHRNGKNAGFEESVLDAVNLGEDTDTVGAVTGGLAGIIYGLNYPRWHEWYEAIRNRETIRAEIEYKLIDVAYFDEDMRPCPKEDAVYGEVLELDENGLPIFSTLFDVKRDNDEPRKSAPEVADNRIKKGYRIDLDNSEAVTTFAKVLFKYRDLFTLDDIGWYVSEDPTEEERNEIEDCIKTIQKNNEKRNKYAKEAAADIVNNRLPDGEREKLLAKPEYIHYHRTVGMWIRNNYIYGKNIDFYLKDADAFGHEIFDEVIRILKGEEIFLYRYIE